MTIVEELKEAIDLVRKRVTDLEAEVAYWKGRADSSEASHARLMQEINQNRFTSVAYAPFYTHVTWGGIPVPGAAGWGQTR